MAASRRNQRITAKRRKNLLFGLLPVVVAVVLLLGQLQTLPDGLQDLIIRAWPALLVTVGLALLLRGRGFLGQFAAVVVSVVLVVGIAVTAYSSRVTQERDDQQLTIEQEIDEDVLLLAVNISTLNTDVEVIRAAQGAEDRITGEFIGSTESLITLDYDDISQETIATFTLEETQADQFPLLEAVGRGTLRLELPPDVPLVLAFVGDDGDVTFNMNALELERLNIDLQSGNALVTLPAYEPLSPGVQGRPGELSVRNGDITIIVPSEVAARLELNRGGNDIRPEFPQSYILIDDGADGTLEKRNIEDDDIVLDYEVTAPGGTIELAVTGDSNASDSETDDED